MVVFGEGDVDVLLLAGAHADYLLLKAGNEGMRAQLQVIVLALAAVEGNAVQGAQEVDVGGVAVLGGAVHGLGSSHILSHPVQFRLDLSLGDFRLGLLHFQVLVLAQSDLRVQLGGQGQGHGLALVVDLHIGQAGTADGLQVLLALHGEVIDLGEDLFQAIFIENMSAVHGLDHLPGRLALPEAGQGDVLPGLHVSLVDAGLHQVMVDLHHDGGVVAVFLYALDVHNK